MIWNILIRIIPTKGIKSIPFWPSIEVQWFYKNNEIDLSKNGIDQRTYDNISDYEVFSSSHKDIILTETVISPCKVLSFEDYQEAKEDLKRLAEEETRNIGKTSKIIIADKDNNIFTI